MQNYKIIKTLPEITTMGKGGEIRIIVEGGIDFFDFEEVRAQLSLQDNTHSLQGDIDLERLYYDSITYLSIKDTKFNSFKGINYNCKILICSDNINLMTFDGLKKSSSIKSISLNSQHGFSITNCHKILSYDLEHLNVTEPLNSGILSLLKFPNFENLFYMRTDYDFRLAAQILNAHLEEDRDMMECREEMIANGLKEYAKL